VYSSTEFGVELRRDAQRQRPLQGLHRGPPIDQRTRAPTSGRIDADRLTHWRRRLSAPTERDVGVLALQEGAPVGFVFAVRDDDERWDP
jgi:hypothetical protein